MHLPVNRSYYLSWLFFLREERGSEGFTLSLQPTCSLPSCGSQAAAASGGVSIHLLPEAQTWLTHPGRRHLRSCLSSFSFNFHYINFTFPGIEILIGWTNLEIKSAKGFIYINGVSSLAGLQGGGDMDGWM